MKLPGYDLLSPTTAIYYISGKLSYHFEQYVPVELGQSWSTDEFDTVAFSIDLTKVYNTTPRVVIPIDLDYSFSGDMISKPTIEKHLKELIQSLL